MKEQKILSIIIPTYQGGKWIKNTISQLLEVFPNSEIIIVNDGSSDDTYKVKNFFGERIIYLENKINQGKGYSLRRGFSVARGKYIIFTDNDLPFGTKSIQEAIELLKGGELVVIGERKIFYNDIFYKSWLRPGLYFILHSLFNLPYQDTQCGLKAFAAPIGKKVLSLTITNRFAIDIEILFLLRKMNIPIKRLEVQQKLSAPSTFNFANIVRMFLDLFVIRFHHYMIT